MLGFGRYRSPLTTRPSETMSLPSVDSSGTRGRVQRPSTNSGEPLAARYTPEMTCAAAVRRLFLAYPTLDPMLAALEQDSLNPALFPRRPGCVPTRDHNLALCAFAVDVRQWDSRLGAHVNIPARIAAALHERNVSDAALRAYYHFLCEALTTLWTAAGELWSLVSVPVAATPNYRVGAQVTWRGITHALPRLTLLPCLANCTRRITLFKIAASDALSASRDGHSDEWLLGPDARFEVTAATTAEQRRRTGTAVGAFPRSADVVVLRQLPMTASRPGQALPAVLSLTVPSGPTAAGRDSGWHVIDISARDVWTVPTSVTRVMLTNEKRLSTVPNNVLRDARHVHSVKCCDTMAHVRTVGDDFLRGCSELLSLDITTLSNVTVLGAFFVADCPRLAALDLAPFANVTKLASGFLCGCAGLAGLNLSPLSRLTHVPSYFLCGCAALRNLDLMPLSNVVHVEFGFLSGCRLLTKLDLLPLCNVTRIGDSFLFLCEGLTEVDLSPLCNVTHAGELFLYACNGLQSIKLPEQGALAPAGHVTDCAIQRR